MPRVVKCLTASARGSFKDLTPIRHKGMKGLRFYQWQRSDQELEMKVGVIFIRFIFGNLHFVMMMLILYLPFFYHVTTCGSLNAKLNCS